MLFESFLLNTCYVCLILISTIYIYFKYTYNYWTKSNIVCLEPAFPFGNVKSVIVGTQCYGDCFWNIYKEMKQKAIQYGGIFMILKPALVIMDPDVIKAIMTKDFAHFSDRAIYSDEASDPLGIHLIAMKGLRWKTLRAKLTPMFTSGKIKMMFHTIFNCTNELGSILNEHIDTNKAVDIRELLAQLATDNIASCGFGLEANSLRDPDNEFRRHGKKVFHFGLRETIINMMSENCPAVLRFFKIPITHPEVTKFFMNVLNQTIKYREKNNVRRKDFLDLLIRLKNKQSVLDDNDEVNEDETGISFNELAAQAFVFFAAGYETSSLAMAFCLYELSCNPEVQETLRSEVSTILLQHNGQLSYESVMAMKYMDKVFNESLRKYPPVPMLTRDCTMDYKIPNSDYICTKGSDIRISVLGLQHDPEYYPDPDKFDPERFSDEQKAKRHPFTYLPFGEGPRNCIAIRFAVLQAKIILATVIKDYKFTLDPKTKTPIQFDPNDISLCPLDTIWLEVSKIVK